MDLNMILDIAIIFLLITIIAIGVLRPVSVEITPTVAAPNVTVSSPNTFSPAFSPSNSINITINATMNYTFANATIQPSGNMTWITNNVTILQQMQNITNNITNTMPLNASDFKCNVLFYVNGSNSTPCLV